MQIEDLARTNSVESGVLDAEGFAARLTVLVQCEKHHHSLLTYKLIDIQYLVASRQSAPPPQYVSITPNSPQELFIRAVTKVPSHSQNLAMACDWYIAFLDSKIRGAWDTLFRPILNIDGISDQPSDGDIGRAFKMFTSIVEEFHTQNLALITMSDKLYNQGFLNELETDDERSIGNQLVFNIVGWISMLSRVKMRSQPALTNILYRCFLFPTPES